MTSSRSFTCKKSKQSIKPFLWYYISKNSLIWLVILTCYTTTTRYGSISLYEILIFIYMQKINFITQFLHKILHFEKSSITQEPEFYQIIRGDIYTRVAVFSIILTSLFLKLQSPSLNKIIRGDIYTRVAVFSIILTSLFLKLQSPSLNVSVCIPSYLICVFLHSDWILRFCSYSVQMRENAGQKNSIDYEHVLRSVMLNQRMVT